MHNNKIKEKKEQEKRKVKSRLALFTIARKKNSSLTSCATLLHHELVPL